LFIYFNKYILYFFIGVPGCGGIYTSPSGIISSPVRLSSDILIDLDSLNCEWHIQMPFHQKLKLEFVRKFGNNYSTDCSAIVLEVCVIIYL